MAVYRVFYRLDGDILVEGDSEEEAREEFRRIDVRFLAKNVYDTPAEIDDLAIEEAAV